MDGSRQKNIIRYDFEGLIGVHITDSGKRMELQNKSLLAIAHYRKIQKECNETDRFMSLFSSSVSKMMNTLFPFLVYSKIDSYYQIHTFYLISDL